MTETLERELKFDVGPRFRLPKLPGEPLPRRMFVSVYYDSPGHCLARHGVTVRRRTEKRRHRWQVKLPRGAARLELEMPGEPTVIPPDLRRLLSVYIRGADLAPIATLLTRRSGVLVRDLRGPVAEVVLDSVSVFEDRRVAQRFREVEVELVGGDEQELERLGAMLRAGGATDSDGRPKVFRVLGLDFFAHPEPLGPSASAVDHVLAMLRAQLDAVRAHDPGTRLGRDPEELHQMRAGVRRLRAILRAARSLLEAGGSEALREELAWLNTALGGRRDLDVLRDYLTTELATLDPPERRGGQRLVRRLDEERERAGQTLLTVLDTPRYFTLLDRIEELLAHPPLTGTEMSLRDLAAEEFRKLRKAVKALPEVPSDEDLHAVRIKAKRARHAAELAVPVEGRPAERFVSKAKRLQDILGEHQDAVVAASRLHELFAGARGRRAGFVAGRLVERQRTRRQAARQAFQAFWPKVEGRGRKAWA
ncbi:MAG: CHAD domain-containing protein [Candidatus Rokuibacteriota bacterium]